MTQQRTTILTIAALAVALAAVGVAEPALAATSDIGKNVGNEVNSWAKILLLGVAGLVGIPALAKRDVGGGLSIVMLVVLIGGFVYAGPEVKGVIEAIWKSFKGG